MILFIMNHVLSFQNHIFLLEPCLWHFFLIQILILEKGETYENESEWVASVASFQELKLDLGKAV